MLRRVRLRIPASAPPRLLAGRLVAGRLVVGRLRPQRLRPQRSGRVRHLGTLLLGAGLLLAACGGGSAELDTPAADADGQATVATASGDTEPAAEQTGGVDAAPGTNPADSREGEAAGEAGDAAAGADEVPVGGGPAAEDDTDENDVAEDSTAGDGTQGEGEDEDDPDAPDPRLELLIELTEPGDLEVVARIGEAVAERRGLALLDVVPVYLLRRADIPAFFAVEEMMEGDGDADPEEPEAEESLFQLLGIIGPDVSLDDLFRDLFVGLALGFYDFDLKGFVIISANDHAAGGDVSTITHEFVHALQDQHFGIADYFDAHEDNADRILAARFVVEGDARSSEALFRDLESELAGQLEARRDRLPGLGGSVPALLQAIFNAPYLTGVSAIGAVLNADGYSGVDALLGALPPSTEQLLHPEKRAARELPVAVAAPDALAALGEDWAALGSDTVGEFILATALSPITGGGAASRAAAGWGGDRLTVYHSAAGADLLVWELRWDSTDDAEEFFATAQDWLRGRTGVSAAPPGADGAVRFAGETLSGWMEHADGAVRLVLGEDAAAVERDGGAWSQTQLR